MKREEYKSWNTKAANGTVSDDKNPAFILSGIDTDLLTLIAAGKIDVKELAKRELENRGLNADGIWVGFGKTIA